MNRTNFEHAGYALLMQLAIGLLTGNWLAGACFGAAFFIGREHAQQQDFYQRGDFEAFDLRKWNLDSILDLVFPVVAVSIVFYLKNKIGI
jgi:hypothetical protein